MIVRPETASDAAAIRAVIDQAFEGHPHSDGSESDIVERLRTTGRLSLSLVAEVDDQLVGHVAFSRVTWDGAGDWYGLGPVAVSPGSQARGVGRALIDAGLGRLRAADTAGCVVFGDPDYYGRFGFGPDERLVYEGAPAGYFMALAFGRVEGCGAVRYDPAFG